MPSPLKPYASFLLVLLIFKMTIVGGQETNYWFHNYGAVSSLKGGIESAGINNPAAIYYNPGALAFMDGDFFDGQADVISLEALNIKNAGGQGIDLQTLQMDLAPSIFVFSRRLKSNQDLSYSLGVLSKYNHNYTFGLQHEQLGNYLLPNTKEDIFQGHYKYENRNKEGWLMGAVAYKINKSIGIGLSTNIFVKAQDYFNSYNALAYHKDERENFGPLTKMASTYEEQKLGYRVLGVIFKPGVNFNFDPLKLGITLTTPSISLGLLNNNSNRSHTSTMPDADPTGRNESNYHNFYKGMYKTPLSINIGAAYSFNNVDLALSGEWFSKIDKYQIIRAKKNSEKMQFPTRSDPNYAIPVMSNKSIVNLGVSVVYYINESLSYIGSMRTDFSYYDSANLDKYNEFVPYISDWDLYHITSGMVFSIKRTHITFGLDYAYGESNDAQQLINMTSASQDNYLKGTIDNSASTRFNSLNLSLGVTFELMNNNSKSNNKFTN